MRRTEALNPKAEMCGVVSDGPAIRLVFCAFGPRLAPVRLELIYCVFTDYKYRNYHCTLWRGPQRQLPLRPYTDILAILSFCTPAHTIFFLLFFFLPVPVCPSRPRHESLFLLRIVSRKNANFNIDFFTLSPYSRNDIL